MELYLFRRTVLLCWCVLVKKQHKFDLLCCMSLFSGECMFMKNDINSIYCAACLSAGNLRWIAWEHQSCHYLSLTEICHKLDFFSSGFMNMLLIFLCSWFLSRLHRIESEYDLLKEEAAKLRLEINRLRTVSFGDHRFGAVIQYFFCFCFFVFSM